MALGVTAKFAPLALLPIEAPSVGVVYQSIKLPADVAFKLEEAPRKMADGVAVTGSGEVGRLKTETDIETEQVHPIEFKYVYVISARPPATPVSTPTDGSSNVAIPIDALLHVPPATELAKVVVEPAHTVVIPVISALVVVKNTSLP